MNTIQEMQERINLLEAEIENLKQPQLMYRRPNSTEYEKVTDFLDDVEVRLKKVENSCAHLEVNFLKMDNMVTYVYNWKISDTYKTEEEFRESLPK